MLQTNLVPIMVLFLIPCALAILKGILLILKKP